MTCFVWDKFICLNCQMFSVQVVISFKNHRRLPSGGVLNIDILGGMKLYDSLFHLQMLMQLGFDIANEPVVRFVKDAV